MKTYLLVPQADIDSLRNALFNLKEFLKYNARVGDFTKHFINPIQQVVNTKYKTATDFQEKDDETSKKTS